LYWNRAWYRSSCLCILCQLRILLQRQWLQQLRQML
jgi:hypothetical protein